MVLTRSRISLLGASTLAALSSGAAACSTTSDSPQLRDGASSSSSSSSSSGDDGNGTSTSSSSSSGGGDDGGSVTDGATSSTSSSGSVGNGSDKPNCKYQAHKTGLVTLQQANGLSFTTYAPTSYDASKGHGVVVIMHGQDSDGVAELNALWKSIADQESLVLLAPKGSRPPTTGTTGANWATADLNNIQDIMTDVDDCYNVFPKKHLLWGFSEGAFYGYLLGIGGATQFSGLAMGGANTSFARQNGYAPKDATWKIPVSDVHGDMDQNPIATTLQDKADFEAAGHVFTLHEHPGGHTITAAQVQSQYDDLKASSSP